MTILTFKAIEFAKEGHELSVSHIFDISATPEFSKIQAFASARFTQPPINMAESFGDFEAKVLELTTQLAASVIKHEMERHDVDVAGVIYQGERYRAKRFTTAEYLTLAGPVRVGRTVYVRRGGKCAKQLVPMEKALGIVNSSWTLKAAEMGCRYMEESTSAKSAELLGLHPGLHPSASHLDRLPKLISRVWESERVNIEAEVAALDELPKEEVGTIMVSLDGIMLPTKDGPSSQPVEGSSVYMEGSCGVVCLLGPEGERLKTLKLGRMPEPKKVTLREQLTQELKRLKEYYPGARWMAIADGARSNWTLLSQIALEVGVKLERLLDFWHGMEHLSTALDLAHGSGSEKAKEELKIWKDTLMTSKHGPGRLIKRLETLAPALSSKESLKLFQSEINYFRTNKEAGRMKWARAANANLPIGSGVTEAACKTLVTQRMKRSGMSWRHDGGQAILTLRSLQQSGRMEAAWLVLGTRFRETVTIDPDTNRQSPKSSLAA